MRRLPYYLLLTLCLVFAACDSDENGDDGGNGGNGGGEAGNFSTEFGGDLSGTFSGNAFFSVIENPDIPGERGFVLFMTDADVTSGTPQFTEYLWFVRLGNRPGTGTYSFSDFDAEDPGTDGLVYGLYASLTNQTTGASLGSQSGTLTITASSDDVVRGTFEFTGTGFDSSEPDQQITATFSGSFEAVDVAAGTIPIFGL